MAFCNLHRSKRTNEHTQRYDQTQTEHWKLSWTPLWFRLVYFDFLALNQLFLAVSCKSAYFIVFFQVYEYTEAPWHKRKGKNTENIKGSTKTSKRRVLKTYCPKPLHGSHETKGNWTKALSTTTYANLLNAFISCVYITKKVCI